MYSIAHLTGTADDIQINNTETTTYIVPFSTIMNKGDYHSEK
jgi:hypothetical protein